MVMLHSKLKANNNKRMKEKPNIVSDVSDFMKHILSVLEWEAKGKQIKEQWEEWIM